MSILASEQNSGNAPYDVRESLWNEVRTGPASLIQVPGERITRLRGVLLDLDPKRLRPDNTLFSPGGDPRQFYENIRPVLARHPLARHAQIRASGSGLHAIVLLDPAVELETAAAQKKWAAVVRAVQCSLPVDPNAPGITALTRPIGSINAKSGTVVELLEPGEPIDPGRVTEFVEGLTKAPFKTVAMILIGCEHIKPCPICRRDQTHLDILDRVGRCYGTCGRVSLARIFDTIFKPIEPAQTAGSHK
jgi:hypothetical protein